MKTYKKMLRIMLVANVLFVLAVAAMGYWQEHNSKEIMKTNATFHADTSNKRKRTDISGKKVIPVGKTVGIYINTKGILVIDTGEVTDIDGKKSNPAKNRLIKGDYIETLNGKMMQTKKQLIDAIVHGGGETRVCGVCRNGEDVEVKVEPVETGVDMYKVGIWVRDDLQGLGTITYADGESFGALGHSITDVDTGELLEVSGGELYSADIFGVEKGIAGTPGEIEGMITYQTENVVGYIDKNQVYGIFGTTTKQLRQELSNIDPIPVAATSEVKEGKAYIQSYVSGTRQLYEIEIVNIHKNDRGDSEMEIQVTDDKLLTLTGGIVQGMSGSPIIQNNKIAGAVTHVFVNDPTKGYGIFMESMME